MKLKKEYHFNPVLKNPLTIILERDFSFLEVYYEEDLLFTCNQKELKKGHRFEHDILGVIEVRRKRKNPPGFEVKVNGFYADESENHPFQRMRSAALFFGVMVLLGATKNLNLSICFFDFPLNQLLLLMFFLSGVLLLFKQAWVIPVTAVMYVVQQGLCFSNIYMKGTYQSGLQMVFSIIFIVWAIRELKTINDVTNHMNQLKKNEDSEVLDIN